MLANTAFRSVVTRTWSRQPLTCHCFLQQQHRHKTTSRFGVLLQRPKFRISGRNKTVITRRPQSAGGSSRTKRPKATLAEAAAAPPRQRRSVWKLIEETLRKPRTVPIPRWISPRHYTITLSEVFGHSAFVLVAMSYAVDDFLMLRMIAVVGASSMLVFSYWHPHGRVLWLPFQWNLLFIAINSYRIGKVFVDRYLAERLSPELVRIRENNFYLMDHVDFAHLVRMGSIKEYKKGDLMMVQGEANPCVRLVINGEFKVLRDGKLSYMLDEGNFISEVGLHVGLMLRGSVESCCSIVVDTDACVICWDRSELVDKMERDASFRRSIKGALSWDIIRKLKSQRLLLKSGLIDNPKEWTERRDQQSQHRYASILHNLLQNPTEMKDRNSELLKYRKVHHIDDEYHRKTLEVVGLTPEDFERGLKEGHAPWMDAESQLFEVYRRVTTSVRRQVKN